jgi:hypothetical protein
VGADPVLHVGTCLADGDVPQLSRGFIVACRERRTDQWDTMLLMRQDRQERQVSFKDGHEVIITGGAAFARPFEWHELGRQSCGLFLWSTESIRFLMCS